MSIRPPTALFTTVVPSWARPGVCRFLGSRIRPCLTVFALPNPLSVPIHHLSSEVMNRGTVGASALTRLFGDGKLSTFLAKPRTIAYFLPNFTVVKQASLSLMIALGTPRKRTTSLPNTFAKPSARTD